MLLSLVCYSNPPPTAYFFPTELKACQQPLFQARPFAVIPAMFHRSVAFYSKALCLSMLATTKIIACECLCVFVCECAHGYSSFAPNSCHSCGRIPAKAAEWTRLPLSSISLFHNGVWIAYMHASVRARA